jgi:hypothetical protein
MILPVLDSFLKDLGRNEVLSASLHQRAEIRVSLMFEAANFTLTEVTFNLQIPEKVQFTIDVSVY